MKLAIALVLVAACGDNVKLRNEAATGQEPPPPRDAAVDVAIDSPPLLTCTPVRGTTVSQRKIGQVSGSAVLATSPPNDGRLFVLEQQGRIRVFENEQLLPDPFLDISTTVASAGEQGLLGLAFHPHYATNGLFYVYFTKGSCTATDPCFDVVERFKVSAMNLNAADATSGEVVLSIPDYQTNHNGGMIEFGPDGYLYIGTGDGGGAGDPHRNAQAIDRTAASCIAKHCEPLLGKILRIDVDHPSGGRAYGIPSDNPFAGGGGEPEIFILGLRNPWRWSFDRATGDLWIGDVGQATYEELDVLPAGQQAGKNLGWSMYEASTPYLSNYPPDPTGKKFPDVIKTHAGDGWYAIIGGEVYRGPCYPDVVGYYIYTDYSRHTLSKAHFDGVSVTTNELPAPRAGWPIRPSSVHGDARGELYETFTSGDVYHIEFGAP